jgi:hypothetical protein
VFSSTTSALFDDRDFSELNREVDKERLKNDEEYRQEILMAMSARQSKKRFNRRVRFIIYVLVVVSALSAGIFIGGYLEPFVARMVVTFIVCLFVVPLMAYLLVIIRRRSSGGSKGMDIS